MMNDDWRLKGNPVRVSRKGRGQGERLIDRLKRCFVEDGLDAALNGRPVQREYEHKIDGEVEAHLVALSCSAPPSGHARWSLRLLK